MNKRKYFSFAAIGAVLAGATVLSILMTEPAMAKKPFTTAEAQDQRNALLAAVAKGDDLWHSAKLGTNGLTRTPQRPIRKPGRNSRPTWAKWRHSET